MSGRNYRTFINNLIASLPQAQYLEIGSWAGSTACAAIEGNKIRAVCIDNWSQFGGPKDKLLKNINRVMSDDLDFTFIENDFRQVDYKLLGTFNVYLFDGPHSKQDQYDGVHLPLPALDNTYFFIIDDWNWKEVRDGTREALNAYGLNVLYEIEVRTTQDGSHAQIINENSDWHNGYFFAVLSKGQRAST